MRIKLPDPNQTGLESNEHEIMEDNNDIFLDKLDRALEEIKSDKIFEQIYFYFSKYNNLEK